jgi:regulatory protein
LSDLKALEKSALNCLSRREHGRAELTLKLIQRGFAVSDVEETVSRLAEKDYLSEKRFVEMLMRSRQQRGVGPVRVQAELEKKGVASSLIAELLDRHDSIWNEAAEQAYNKKYGDSIPENTEDKLKRMQHLRYKGFTQAQINCVINDYVG